MARNRSWSIFKWFKLLLNMFWGKKTYRERMIPYGLSRRRLQRYGDPRNSIHKLMKLKCNKLPQRRRYQLERARERNTFPIKSLRSRNSLRKPVAKMLDNFDQRKRRNKLKDEVMTPRKPQPRHLPEARRQRNPLLDAPQTQMRINPLKHHDPFNNPNSNSSRISTQTCPHRPNRCYADFGGNGNYTAPTPTRLSLMGRRGAKSRNFHACCCPPNRLTKPTYRK